VLKVTRPAAVGLAVVSATALGTLLILPANARAANPTSEHKSNHVLLISVDGMHQSDLDWYVAQHPGSALAKLTRSGPSTAMRRPRTPQIPTQVAPH
jgi:hypothetical protein